VVDGLDAVLGGHSQLQEVLPLLAQPLAGQGGGIGEIERVEPFFVHHRHLGQGFAIQAITLGVFLVVLAQGVDLLTLHPMGLPAALLEGNGHREPRHTGGLHHGAEGSAWWGGSPDPAIQLVKVFLAGTEAPGLGPHELALVGGEDGLVGIGDSQVDSQVPGRHGAPLLFRIRRGSVACVPR